MKHDDFFWYPAQKDAPPSNFTPGMCRRAPVFIWRPSDHQSYTYRFDTPREEGFDVFTRERLHAESSTLLRQNRSYLPRVMGFRMGLRVCHPEH